MPLKFPRGAKDEVAKNAIREYLLPENTLSGAKIAEKYGLTKGLFFDHLNKYRNMQNKRNEQNNKNYQNYNHQNQNNQNYNYQNEQNKHRTHIKVSNKQYPEHEMYKDEKKNNFKTNEERDTIKPNKSFNSKRKKSLKLFEIESVIDPVTNKYK